MTLNRFAPLADSVLRSLEYANVSDENLKISEIIEAERGLTEKERMFLAELNLPSLDLITDAIAGVREQEMVLKIHDLPTIFHFRYWVQVCIERFLVRFRSPPSRKKISSET